MEIAREEIYRLLRQRTGLDAACLGEAVMARALRARMSDCAVGDLEEYRKLLVSSPAQLQELVEAIVVPETWFFRTPATFAHLARFATEWGHKHPGERLRVLSAPCSTGEEPYSIAMTLLDAGMGAHQFAVDGIDISARALAQARHGVYRDYSFRSRDPSLRARHFCANDEGYLISESVRATVRFERGNLLELRQGPRYHVIFCRNLLIYFDRAAQDAAIAVLAGALTPDGLVFVGPSEAFCLRESGLAPTGRTDAFAFARRPASVPRSVAGPAISAAKKPVAASPRRPDGALGSLSRPPLAHRPNTPLTNASSRKLIPRQAPAPPGHEPASPDDLLDRIAKLADAGSLAQAQALCETHLAGSAAGARGYYLMALLRDARGDRGQAIEFYRKALYLEPNYTDAMLQLALLLGQQGHGALAGNMRARARRARERSGQ